ncbi:MAG: PmoA family protein, partial [Planctomycetaceae bacterium]|nr:PmoA family protein [Planctomycetaceae bacterium]
FPDNHLGKTYMKFPLSRSKRVCWNGHSSLQMLVFGLAAALWNPSWLSAASFELSITPTQDCYGHLVVSAPLTEKSASVLSDGWYRDADLSPAGIGHVLVYGGHITFRTGTNWKATQKKIMKLDSVPEPESHLSWESRNGDLLLIEGKQTHFVYNEQMDEPPAKTSPLYRRSGYVHPLTSPAGFVLTDDFPVDHLHQHGLFTAWVNVNVAGKQVDFWNQAKGEGTIRHQKLIDQWSNPLAAGMHARLEHIQTPTNEPEKSVLAEDWELISIPHPSLHVLEWRSTQQNLLEEPVVLNQNHYGGYAVRGPAHWLSDQNGQGCQMQTNQTADRVQGNHTRATWVAMSGLAQPGSTAQAGVALIGHPENLRAPQPVRLHPSKPYFCFCPVVEEAITLSSDDKLRARFLVVTFDGTVPVEQLQELTTEFGATFLVDSNHL